MSLTRQGVRNLNHLPGRRVTPPRVSTTNVVHHSCWEKTFTVSCGMCLYHCSCETHCTICGRRLA